MPTQKPLTHETKIMIAVAFFMRIISQPSQKAEQLKSTQTDCIDKHSS